jgi:hypothetical protein
MYHIPIQEGVKPCAARNQELKARRPRRKRPPSAAAFSPLELLRTILEGVGGGLAACSRLNTWRRRPGCRAPKVHRYLSSLRNAG